MKHRIRLTENNLHRIILESVKRILKEKEEYDWDYSEEDLPFIKKIENDASWKEKEVNDRNLRNASQIWDLQGSSMYNHKNNFGAGYDGNISNEDFDNISDRVNDSYFENGPYRFVTNTKWDDDDFPFEDEEVEELFSPSSSYNKPYKKI